ncbi:hypothetical protein CQW23_34242 [Capsicum baccatum]|uniref:Uncharacterized protein n=1 Tax=Capsicum baccatum TaxID=33114 RepID=A0A2G2UZE5_CAPBA|nr:hypothetical protein CQW23_34242 [Capsicum baccatum]
MAAPPGLAPKVLQRRHALLLIGAWNLPHWPGVGRALKRYPFSGLVDSAAKETDFEQAYIALAPRLRWQAGQDVAARVGIQPNRTYQTQLMRRASKCSVDARPAPAPTPDNRCRALLPMQTAWSSPRGQHPGLAARTKAPPRLKSSASSPVVDDATDNRHERTMKRRRRCYTGMYGSHELAMHAAMHQRCTPTLPLSAYAS